MFRTGLFIPRDIYRHIRYYLDFKEVHRLRRVSKAFSIFDESELRQLYARYSLKDLVIIGDLFGIRYLLSQGHVFVCPVSARYLSISNGHLAVFEFMIDHVLDDDDIEMTLTQACLYGHIKIVEFLLSRYVYSRTTYNNALYIASRYGHVTVKNALMVSLSISLLLKSQS